ncbi:MAG: DUF1330 domain-containing protein [Saprospiraceae bacterium]|nr:DUF1330 domain-containing protein [Saprospiraceae bacterium]
MPLYFTQLIYIKNGAEETFHQFEDVAIPLIAKYNGQLLLRLRPTLETIVEANMPQPYEVHLVEFESKQDFQNFMGDEERKQFLHLKEASIESVWLIEGQKL